MLDPHKILDPLLKVCKVFANNVEFLGEGM
jgi:hypothetical protein